MQAENRRGEKNSKGQIRGGRRGSRARVPRIPSIPSLGTPCGRPQPPFVFQLRLACAFVDEGEGQRCFLAGALDVCGELQKKGFVLAVVEFGEARELAA